MPAATPVVARLGRAGATTKIIAQAAGVSEALLYKHFPAKDALYAQLERHCVEANAVGTQSLDGATPSTATLVTGVAVLVRAVFPGIGRADAHDDTKRLVTPRRFFAHLFSYFGSHENPFYAERTWKDLGKPTTTLVEFATSLHRKAELAA